MRIQKYLLIIVIIFCIPCLWSCDKYKYDTFYSDDVLKEYFLDEIEVIINTGSILEKNKFICKTSYQDFNDYVNSIFLLLQNNKSINVSFLVDKQERYLKSLEDIKYFEEKPNYYHFIVYKTTNVDKGRIQGNDICLSYDQNNEYSFTMTLDKSSYYLLDNYYDIQEINITSDNFNEYFSIMKDYQTNDEYFSINVFNEENSIFFYLNLIITIRINNEVYVKEIKFTEKNNTIMLFFIHDLEHFSIDNVLIDNITVQEGKNYLNK